MNSFLESAAADAASNTGRLAVLCEPDGLIRDRIVDELGIFASSSERRFEEIVVPECREKARSFVRDVASNRSAFGWELNLETDTGVRSLQFAGSASDRELLVIGGRSTSDLIGLYSDLQKSGDDRLVKFREHLRHDVAARHVTVDRHSELWDALSSANNELANSQRQLAQRAVQLERASLQRDDAVRDLLRLKEALEARVIERTRQLQETNSELEAFSYSVSHDLRAPLRHISGFADLLLRSGADNLTDAQRRYVQVIAESTKEAGTLVDDLLSFARMGRTDLMHAEVDVHALVEGVIAEFAPETEARGIRWTIANGLPTVVADRAMLRLVFRNLVSNAVKYTGRTEKPSIEIGFVRASDLDAATIPEDQRPEEHDLVFFVRDNGVGFEMEYVAKLFGVFQRLHRSEDYSGTGIGLANVRRIIRRHGGRTWAVGAIDRGATLYFSLPANLEVRSA